MKKEKEREKREERKKERGKKEKNNKRMQIALGATMYVHTALRIDQ